MTFRLKHEWVTGAKLPRLVFQVNERRHARRVVQTAAELAVCEHCSTLRVTEDGNVTFVRRELRDEERASDDERAHRRAAVRSGEPPCIEPQRHFAAPW